jgi:hypothetical protein
MTEYFNPVTNSNIASEKISLLKPDQQVQVMENWFRENYEDPAQSTPYSSDEGGYVFIWGGPFDAYDELYNEFAGSVDDELIRKLANKLSGDCEYWAKTDYESKLIQDIASISDYFHNFAGAISDVEALLALKIPNPQQIAFYRIIYASVVTALETYLGDAFINNVISKQELLEKYLEAVKDLKKEKIALGQHETSDQILLKVKEKLGKIVWHNLDKAKLLYEKTLGINFPDSYLEIKDDIQLRHHIVHRNGKDKEGDEFIIMPENIYSLIERVRTLVIHIDSALAEIAN